MSKPAVSPPSPSPPPSPLSRVDRARYRVRQQGLALWLGATMRLVHAAMNPRIGAPPLGAIRALRRRFEALLDADLANVDRGYYPRDVLFQLRARDFLRHLPSASADVPRFARRVRAQRFDDLPRDVDLSAFPAYYTRNFHWQTDGWLSARSARLYDMNVEVLFGGTGDVMRRMAIPPLVDGVREALRGEVRSARVLDIACGTGRYLTTLARALPGAQLTGVDLSPPYVARAAKAIAHLPGARAIAANAESLPFETNHFDAATSIFLFHELPSDVRRRVLGEALRVLRPGGRLVVLDAAQLPEAEEVRFFLDAFQRLYHEPYFKGYLRDDLGAAAREIGFRHVAETSHFFAKVVVVEKPSAAH